MLRKLTVFLAIAAMLVVAGCRSNPAEAPNPSEMSQQTLPMGITY